MLAAMLRAQSLTPQVATCSYCGNTTENEIDRCPQCGTYYSDEVRERVEAEIMANSPPPKSPFKILFSFQGRISRLTFFLYYLAAEILVWSTWAVAMWVWLWATPLFLFFFFVTRWCEVALLIKRMKDFDRSPGYYVFISFIPVIGHFLAFILFIEGLGRDGSPGKNRFGLDPLGRMNTGDFIPPGLSKDALPTY